MTLFAMHNKNKKAKASKKKSYDAQTKKVNEMAARLRMTSKFRKEKGMSPLSDKTVYGIPGAGVIVKNETAKTGAVRIKRNI